LPKRLICTRAVFPEATLPDRSLVLPDGATTALGPQSL
jgi:hypothetical protein